MKRPAIAAVLIVAFVAPLWAGYDESEEAYKLGDYVTAALEFREGAEQGSANAQAALGWMVGERFCCSLQ